jgi:Polyketide cyclase / dehydrase and lipid transport
MSSWKQQALIEAPVAEVWGLLCDPNQGSRLSEDVIAVTGAPVRIEKGSTFKMTSRGPLGMKGTTTFKVEELEDMREVKVQCQVTGFYTHWILTEAQGGTFTELELGVERLERRRGVQGLAVAALHTKSHLRRLVDELLDGLRGAMTPDIQSSRARARD